MEVQGSRVTGSLGLGLGQAQCIGSYIQNGTIFLMKTAITISRDSTIFMLGKSIPATQRFCVTKLSTVGDSYDGIIDLHRRKIREQQEQSDLITLIIGGIIDLFLVVVIRLPMLTLVRYNLTVYLSTLRTCRMISLIFRYNKVLKYAVLWKTCI